ncbi:MAG TPA: TonB-dependent receptor [Bryobacteraceae bacterium]|nr:TonB-dependent receptor [Bryobacteraceae bacterium]
MWKPIVGGITVFVAGILLCAGGLSQLHAQQNGTISGTVSDQSGKPIQEAAVELKSESTGASRSVITDAEGKFLVSDLAAGSYSVRVSAPGFALTSRSGGQVTAGATLDIPITMSVESVTTSVTVNESISVAAVSAPSGNTLEATSAKTEVSSEFIKNFMSPVADYAEYVNYAPGTFSVNPNGIGLGQGKTFFRGFADGQYTMTFDGIPFEDTNSPTHHSWANFPSGWTDAVDFDRSSGRASDFGPTNFGGSINMFSPQLFPDPDIRGTINYGSFNTRVLQLDAESGFFGPGSRNSFLMNMQQLLSDGYQTYNRQKRVAGYGKYQYRVSDRSSLTLYGGLVDIWTNTPNTTNPTRAQVAQFGDNYLLDNTPFLANGTPDPYYYGYNTYHVQTDFEYAAYNADLGGGWKFNTKLYTTRYWNKQFYQNGATVNLTSSKPSGVDKLNGYRHAGDTAILSKETHWGVFRTGIWYDWAYTDRYQIPSNILTQQDTPLGNFHEHFITQSVQPFAEFEWHATPRLVATVGMKAADYAMTLNQYQDNGKTVGCLGGVASTYPGIGAPACIGGVQFVTHSINYNNWLPNVTARYYVQSSWSVYAQFAEGSVIPLSSVFDVPNANVLVPPKPTLAKTYQIGSVMKHRRWTLDADAYYIHFQNGYDSYIDPTTNEPVFVATGPSNTKGVEAESSFILGYGLSLYANGTMGSAKYQTGPNYPNGGLWVANAPKNVETVSLLWRHNNLNVGLVDKRVGSLYNDNATLNYLVNGVSIPFPVDEALKIDPFNVVNFFANYTVKSRSWLRGSKIGVAFNNLANSHNVVGITPGAGPTASAHYVESPSDLLNLLPGRSVMLTFTAGWAPRR